MSYYSVIGIGDTSQKALLFARINQIGFNRGIKDGTISKKTKCYEISLPRDMDYRELIKIIYMGYNYYLHQNKKREEFSESEYQSYKKLIIFYGKTDLIKIMSLFENTRCNTSLCINIDETRYQFLY